MLGNSLLCLGSPPRHGSGTRGQHISPVLSVCPELEGELHRCVSSGLATWRDPVIVMTVEEGYDTSVTCQSQQLGMAPPPYGVMQVRRARGGSWVFEEPSTRDKSMENLTPAPSEHFGLRADVTSFQATPIMADVLALTLGTSCYFSFPPKHLSEISFLSSRLPFLYSCLETPWRWDLKSPTPRTAQHQAQSRC